VAIVRDLIGGWLGIAVGSPVWVRFSDDWFDWTT